MLYTIIFKLCYWLFLVLFLWIDDPRTMEEDALILKVIEAYCTSAKTRHTVNSCKYWGMVTSGGHQGVGVVMCNVCSFSGVIYSCSYILIGVQTNGIIVSCCLCSFRCFFFITVCLHEYWNEYFIRWYNC